MASITVLDASRLNGALAWCSSMIQKGIESGPVVITFSRESRTDEQNRKMWPMLKDFEPINHNGRLYKDKDWKSLIMSAFNGEMPIVGLRGEIVNLNLSTKALSKKRFSELIEFIYAEGSDLGVDWSERALDVYDEYKESNNP